MILVTGATGKVGGQVVAQLLDRGTPVRAVARDPESARLPAAVEVARADLADPGSVEPCLTGGIESVFLVWPLTSPQAAADLAPQAVTQAEQVRAIGAAIGRPLRFEEITRQSVRQDLVGAFGNPAFADSAQDTWAGFVSQPGLVTSTVRDVTGRPARSFRAWAADHAEDFT